MIIILKKMKVRLLRKLRKKAKNRTWMEYSNGYYSACQKINSCYISRLPFIKNFHDALRELNDLRRRVILEWVEKMKGEMEEKKINKEIRCL